MGHFTEVTYYYAKESAGVKEEHIDIVTGKVINKETYKGYEGDKYITYAKDFNGYVLVKEHYPENAEGTMTKEELDIKYYYARIAKVEVEYIDQETKAKIIDNVIIEGHEGKRYETEVKAFEGYKLFDKPYNSTGKMKITEDEDGELENTTKVRYYYIKEQEENKPNEEKPTEITNIYNNMTLAEGNGSTSNNGTNSGAINSNNGNGVSNNNSGVNSYEKTPVTGDKITVVVITVLILIVTNIVLWIIHRKRKDKKNFIK